MDKEKLIELMKTYKKNCSKKRLRIIDRDSYQKELDRINSEIFITTSYGINNDIRSKNQTSDKVANKVINDENKKDELYQKIKALDEEIDRLNKDIEQVDIRLACLYENQKQLVIAFYIEGKTAEDIGDRLFLELFRRTCSVNGVYKIINKCVNIMCEL